MNLSFRTVTFYFFPLVEKDSTGSIVHFGGLFGEVSNYLSKRLNFTMEFSEKSVQVAKMGQPTKNFVAAGSPMHVHVALFSLCLILNPVNKSCRTYTYTFPVQPSDGNWGNPHPNGSFDGMLGLLQRGLADFAPSAVSLTFERKKVFSFIDPFFYTHRKFYIK